MIDLFDYTDINVNHQAFFTNGITNSWQVWMKPKGVSYVYITCIGGGGGGGIAPNVGGSNTGGGGGGAASSVTKIMLPANVLPDTLYIQVGRGGIGGSASNENSEDGNLSYVAIFPSTLPSRVIIASGTDPAGRGLRGTTLVGGTGGSAGTVFTSAVGILSELGIWQSVAGRIGANGGFSTNGGNVTGVGSGTFVTGGAGGGGLSSGNDFNGGSILATGSVLNFNVAGGAAGGGQGRGGYSSLRPKDLTYASRKFPLILTGGSGGGGNATISGGGGNGGPGQIGCGGGGAGAQDGGSGRFGGRGGDGIVLITTF